LSYVHRTPKEILVAVSEEQQQHEQEWLEQMNQLQKSAQKSGSL
jgi:flagellar motor component MotA